MSESTLSEWPPCDEHDGIRPEVAMRLREGGKENGAAVKRILMALVDCPNCAVWHRAARRVWAENEAARIPNDMTPYRVNQRFPWHDQNAYRGANSTLWASKLQRWIRNATATVEA